MSTTPDGSALFTVTEEDDQASRTIHRYDRVTDITLAVDSIFGDSGNDVLVGNRDTSQPSKDELKDLVLRTDRLVGKLADMDFDDDVDFDDIAAWVTALSDPATYVTTYGIANHEHGDLDGDGDVDFDDNTLFPGFIGSC